MPRKENASAPANAQAQQDLVSEGIENYELPRALVTRIAKSAVCISYIYHIHLVPCFIRVGDVVSAWMTRRERDH